MVLASIFLLIGNIQEWVIIAVRATLFSADPSSPKLNIVPLKIGNAVIDMVMHTVHVRQSNIPHYGTAFGFHSAFGSVQFDSNPTPCQIVNWSP